MISNVFFIIEATIDPIHPKGKFQAREKESKLLLLPVTKQLNIFLAKIAIESFTLINCAIEQRTYLNVFSHPVSQWIST